MLLAALVAVCVASHSVASAAILPLPEKVYYDLENAENLFKDHVKAFQKKYDVENYNKRLEIFKANLKMINEMNAKYPETGFGVTRFADFTKEEIRSFYGRKPMTDPIIEKDEIKINIPPIVKSEPVPVSFNWRDHGAVTHVKYQHMCSSHVFSAIGNIEGQYAIKHKQCIAFSEQQCLDCLPLGGCGGGLMDDVMNELAKRPGCMTEVDYPYLAKDNQTCHEKADKVVAKVTGALVFNITNAGDLKQKLFNYGPLSIAMSAADLLEYKSGILHPVNCTLDSRWINHAVLLVGYGEEKGVKYWIIKNSWGDEFGENGYLRLLRGVDACGAELGYITVARVD